MQHATTQTSQAQVYYVVTLRANRRVAGPFTELKRARRAMDRKDLAYGGYAHQVIDANGKAGGAY